MRRIVFTDVGAAIQQPATVAIHVLRCAVNGPWGEELSLSEAEQRRIVD